MGRFSSVQTYTDTASDKRTVPYEQARGTQVQQASVVQPEKSSIPGSGEFHIYRQARAREMQRQAQLQLTAQEQEEAQAFALQVQQEEEECAARTAKKRAKQQKQKESKMRKRNLEQAGIVLEAPAVVATTANVDDEEFVYVPETNQVEDLSDNNDKKTNTVAADKAETVSFPNDGSSFLDKSEGDTERETSEQESATLS